MEVGDNLKLPDNILKLIKNILPKDDDSNENHIKKKTSFIAFIIFAGMTFFFTILHTQVQI